MNVYNVNDLCWLGSETQARGAGAVEDDELAFEEDVTIDGKTNSRIRLDAPEAGRAADRGIVNVFTRDNGVVRADTEDKVGESGWARESVAALGGVAGVNMLALLSCRKYQKVANYEAPETCL
jgi:hypothetical protein